MTTIYITGSLIGDHEIVKNKFKNIADELSKKWFKVINPFEQIDLETPWEEAMEIGLKSIDESDAIYVLPCTLDSLKAQSEVDHAIINNKMIYYEMQNLEDEKLDDIPS